MVLERIPWMVDGSVMISKKIPDSSVPMSLLADHPNVHFHFLRSGIGSCDAEMH